MRMSSSAATCSLGLTAIVVSLSSLRDEGQIPFVSIAELAHIQTDDILILLDSGFRSIDNDSFEQSFSGLFRGSA